jgi:hypothetical protein
MDEGATIKEGKSKDSKRCCVGAHVEMDCTYKMLDDDEVIQENETKFKHEGEDIGDVSGPIEEMSECSRIEGSEFE